MGGKVIRHAKPGHACDPGWEEGTTTEDSDLFPKGSRYGIPPTSSKYPAGTIWQCECGKTWVSLGTPERARDAGHVLTCFWRREHWWERRRRERQVRL
jgi:hypothetical protein